MLFVLLLVLVLVLLLAYHKHRGKDDKNGNELNDGEGNAEEHPGCDSGYNNTARKAEGHEDRVGTGRRCLDDECIIAIEYHRIDDTEQNCQPSARKCEAREYEGNRGNDKSAHNRKDGCGQSLIAGVVVGVESCEK